MEIRISRIVGLGMLLSYLVPGLLVIVVVPDRNTKGFIWVISIYFTFATFLYLATAYKLFYRRGSSVESSSSMKTGNESCLDSPPTYTEVSETPPPYGLLPKKYKKTSSKLRRELASPSDPHKCPPVNRKERSTFKRLVSRSKSLITDSSHVFSTKKALQPLRETVSVPLSSKTLYRVSLLG